MKNLSIEKCITPFAKQAKCTPETSLGTAADLVRTSTDPIFVFESLADRAEGKNLLGLVSLYDALYTHGLPMSAHASSALFHPAPLTKHSSLYDAADEMIAHRLTVLPVFDESGREIVGIITARSVVQAYFHSDAMARALRVCTGEKAYTVSVHAFVKDAFHPLRSRKKSEVVVTRPDGSIAGIASRADVMRSKSKPTRRQRYQSKGDLRTFSKEQFYEREGPKRDYYQLDRYYHPVVSVERMRGKDPEKLREYIAELIATPYTSIVLVDARSKPREILTYFSLLEALSRTRPTHEVPILFHDQRVHYSAIEKERIRELLERFTEKIQEREPIYRAYISFEEQKTMKGRPRAIQTVLKIVFKSGNVCTAKSVRPSALESFRETLRQEEVKIQRTRERVRSSKRYPSRT